MKREPPRRKKHVAPQPPRLKVLSAEQKRQIEDSNLKQVFNSSPAILAVSPFAMERQLYSLATHGAMS